MCTYFRRQSEPEWTCMHGMYVYTCVYIGVLKEEFHYTAYTTICYMGLGRKAEWVKNGLLRLELPSLTLCDESKTAKRRNTSLHKCSTLSSGLASHEQGCTSMIVPQSQQVGCSSDETNTSQPPTQKRNTKDCAKEETAPPHLSKSYFSEEICKASSSKGTITLSRTSKKQTMDDQHTHSPTMKVSSSKSGRCKSPLDHQSSVTFLPSTSQLPTMLLNNAHIESSELLEAVIATKYHSKQNDSDVESPTTGSTMNDSKHHIVLHTHPEKATTTSQHHPTAADSSSKKSSKTKKGLTLGKGKKRKMIEEYDGSSMAILKLKQQRLVEPSLTTLSQSCDDVIDICDDVVNIKDDVIEIED